MEWTPVRVRKTHNIFSLETEEGIEILVASINGNSIAEEYAFGDEDLLIKRYTGIKAEMVFALAQKLWKSVN